VFIFKLAFVIVIWSMWTCINSFMYTRSWWSCRNRYREPMNIFIRCSIRVNKFTWICISSSFDSESYARIFVVNNFCFSINNYYILLELIRINVDEQEKKILKLMFRSTTTTNPYLSGVRKVNYCVFENSDW
jgi:hypothetical protein